MHILLIHNYYQKPGGEDTVFAAEKALLSQSGHRISEFTDHNIRIEGMSAPTVAVKTIWSKKSLLQLSRIIAEDPPDLAHFHNTFPLISPSAYYACHKMQIPVVQTLHNYRLHCPVATLYRDGHPCEDCIGKKIPWPSLVHRCYHDSFLQTATVSVMISLHRALRTWSNKVTAYIALTNFAKKLFVSGGIPEQKIYVKPNFVFPDQKTSSSSGRYFLFVGRITKQKGVHTLLKAWEGLSEIPLQIIGQGPELEELIRKTKFPYRGSIKVLGQRTHEEVLSMVRNAYCLIFPSESYEGFPITILEAFSSGTPVIASNIGGIPEIVRNYENGLLFDPCDSDQLRYKVNWAFSHQNQIRQMGQKARRTYEQKYTPEKNYEDLIEIYHYAIRSVRGNFFQ